MSAHDILIAASCFVWLEAWRDGLRAIGYLIEEMSTSMLGAGAFAAFEVYIAVSLWGMA